jgi:hypothetical protein
VFPVSRFPPLYTRRETETGNTPGRKLRPSVFVNAAPLISEIALVSKMSSAAFASLLLLLASKVRLELFKKHKRGPKKPRQKLKADPSHPHVSTARLLSERRGK